MAVVSSTLPSWLRSLAVISQRTDATFSRVTPSDLPIVRQSLSSVLRASTSSKDLPLILANIAA